MAIIGSVFARGGSKGIPKKNLSKINGLSLTKIALKSLIKSSLCKEIYLCSDDDEILNESKNMQIEIFKRNKSNCRDNSSEIDAWREFAGYLITTKNYDEKDLLLITPCTSPLRNVETLIGIIKKLNKNPEADGIICIKKSNVLPDFNLLKKNKDNFLNIYINGKRKINRQNSSPAWEMTTIAYCYKLGSIIQNKDLFELNTIGYDVKFPESLDIDTYEDLDLARKLMNQ